MLKLERVAKKYKGAGRYAVHYLDLDIPRGEIFGFLGPNGAGKTTTIKMIVGLLEPDQGKIQVNGFDVTEDPVGAKRSCGFVPDNPELYPRLTGIEYLNLMGDVYQVPGDLRKKRIDYYLNMFELTGAVGDLIQSYSRGMRQKLALTGALLHNPPLFILDEPMVGLDPKSSHLFKEVMREHVREGNTVFFSTHVLEVAEKFCDRVGIIHNGKLIACGTLEELREQSQQEDSSLEKIFLQLTEEGERP
ncbi:MAG: ABC transporter ATP-binding protein [Firmicutes bacterium]|nr:ABC transporter ATP-binding protein [Bacillota bacterium]NLO66343.1 ABC transporter ATP-binding protein [Bacillota bacterium]